jgi:hypothetical protein
MNLLQERWKYLLIYYIIGYLISIMQSGVPNLYYLVPLKPFAIAMGWGVGNGTYQISKEMKRTGVRAPMYRNFYYAAKYGIPAIIMTFIYCFLIVIIGGIFKFDSTPFIAPLK